MHRVESESESFTGSGLQARAATAPDYLYSCAPYGLTDWRKKVQAIITNGVRQIGGTEDVMRVLSKR
jgi:hypothetical protein